MRIEPLRDMVLVTPDAMDDAPTAGAIQVVRLEVPPTWRGIVRAVGPEVREARAGQRVVMSRLQGIEIDGGVLLPEDAILGYLTEAP